MEEAGKRDGVKVCVGKGNLLKMGLFNKSNYLFDKLVFNFKRF